MIKQTSDIHIWITADVESVEMGRSVRVDVNALFPKDTDDEYLLMPFVNRRRWGSCERAGQDGKVSFILPLPNPGLVHIEVIAMKVDTDHWMGLEDADILLAGRSLPENAIKSNCLDVQVMWRAFNKRDLDGLDHTVQGGRHTDHGGKPTNQGTLFGMQWEPWFCHGIRSWQTAQVVPLVGFYDSYNRDVTRQHILWMMDIGVDFIFPDWTNHIWGCGHWDERKDGVNAIVHATTLMLEVLAEMKAEGLPVPQVVLFPGLSNGLPATMEALNEELAWIYHTYVRNPRFEGLWLEYQGKPLTAVLDTGAVGDKRGKAKDAFKIPFFKQTLGLNETELDAFRAAQPAVDNRFFTVRWMSSQNDTTHHHELGYWSWMDGSIEPPVTYHNGEAEAVTVSVGFFGATGWTGSGGHGRRGGATLLETFKQVYQHNPRFVFLHQFNEYSGQTEGHGYGPARDIYVDTYSVELSDDMEPVSLTAPGYRGDQGGWGFYYINLSKALIEIHRGQGKDSTVLVVSSPLEKQQVEGDRLEVAWSWAGKPPEDIQILVDGEGRGTFPPTSPAVISLDGLPPGWHVLTLQGAGVATCFPLSKTTLDIPLEDLIPVQVNVPFYKALGGV